MEVSYDDIASIGIDTFKKLEYSPSCRSSFKVTAMELKHHLLRCGLEYSLENAEQWVEQHRKHWNGREQQLALRTLRILNDIAAHGAVTDSLEAPTDRMSAYQQLPPWSKTLLDEHCRELSQRLDTSHVTLRQNACAMFFLFLERVAISEPSHITHKVLLAFFNRTVHKSAATKDRYDNWVRCCLLSMAEKHIIPETIGIALNKFILPDLVFMDEFSDVERERFHPFVNADTEETLASGALYDGLVECLLMHLVTKQYSESNRTVASQAFRDFKISFKQLE